MRQTPFITDVGFNVMQLELSSPEQLLPKSGTSRRKFSRVGRILRCLKRFRLPVSIDLLVLELPTEETSCLHVKQYALCQMPESAAQLP